MTNTNAVREAAMRIVLNSENPALNYAVNYATHLAKMVFTNEPINDIRVQCLYVLNNIQYWRGEEAKAVRKTLKDFCAETDPRRRSV